MKQDVRNKSMVDALPDISIVILIWNSRREIKRLLRSIERSSYPNVREVIIVDNGSTDGAVEEIKKKFPEVRLIELKKNYGVWARNYGFKQAKGEVIVNLDSDAVLPGRETLTKAVMKAGEDPKLGILGVKVVNKVSKLPELSPSKLNFYTGSVLMMDPEVETTKSTWVPFILAVIPRNTFEKVGYLNKAFRYGDDLNFCLRIREKGLRVRYWPGTYVYHYRTKERADVAEEIKYRYYYKAIFENIYEYGSGVQKLSVTGIQLVWGSIFGLIMQRKNTFKARWWGWWWNIKNLSWEVKLFLGAFIGGGVMRIVGLGWHDFWFDEAFTYQVSRLPIRELAGAVLTDNNPPLYYLLIHGALQLGESETWLRLPSLLANLAAAGMLARLGRRLISKRAGLIAAALWMVSPLAIYMATEARLHSLAGLLVLLIIEAFAVALKRPGVKNLAWLGMWFVVGAYTQYYVALLWFPLSVIAMRGRQQIGWKKWWGLSGVVLVSVMPWLVLSAKIVHNGCSCPSTWLSLPAALVSPILGGVGEVSLRQFSALPGSVLGLFVITIGLAGWGFIKGVTKASWWSGIYWIPLGILSGLGWGMPVFSPKAFGVYSGVFFLILAKGLDKLSFKWVIALVGLMALVSGIQVTGDFFEGTRLRPLAEITGSERSTVVAHTSVISYYSLDYYAKGRQEQMLITKNPLSPATLKYIGGEKQEIDPGIERLWLVDTEKWAGPEYEQVLAGVWEEYEAISSFQVDETKVWLLQSKNLRQ